MVGMLVAFLAETIVGFGAVGAATVERFGDDAVVLLAAALCLLRAVDEPGGRRAPWVLLSGGVLAWALGTMYWSVVPPARAGTGAALGDLGWLTLYPLSGIAFLALARTQLGRLDLRLGIDVLIAAAALLAFLAGDLHASLAQSGYSPAAWIIVCFTIGDLVLVATAVAIGSASRWQLDRCWIVLLAGFSVTVVGDRLYLDQAATGGSGAGDLIDAVWSCSAAMIGLASGIALPPARPDRRLAGAIGLPIVLASGALVLVAYSSVAEVDPVAVLLAAGSLSAVLIRLVLTHRDHRLLLEQADEHAHVDLLTGLGNRRGLARDFPRIAAASATELRLSLFDLDGFKDYNDRHGHLAGDELLTRASGRMRAAVADAGRCYRLGGDEFCLVVGVSEDGSGAVTERVAAALTEGEVGCSVGSITMNGAMTLTEGLRRADERMYANKRARRALALRRENAVVRHVEPAGDPVRTGGR